ncbi:MAG: hypothetical protein ACI9F9_001835, partial [Candidatus Paceibacteria bacterium]
EVAVARVAPDEREAMRWLIAHMPLVDLTSLDADYLVANHRLAFESWNDSPWRATVDRAHFLDAVLPYASVNERRDPWRSKLRERCLPMVEGATSPSQAAAMLNNAIWNEFNVKYSTQRAKPDQSPFETMESGLASCTGLSVLLIDACRSVGVPARFVGTPRWSDDSGNHSWVEIWDDGWHYTGAAEPTGMDLDRGWFAGRAAGALREQPGYAIYAVSWRSTPISFPLVWLPDDETVNAVNVTDRYTGKGEALAEGQVRVRFQALEPAAGKRVKASVALLKLADFESGGATFDSLESLGSTRDESFDANDHLVMTLDDGESYVCSLKWNGRQQQVSFVAEDELLIRVGHASEHAWATAALSSEQAKAEAERQWVEYGESARADAVATLASGELQHGELKLPFWYTTFGEAPQGGHSLYISMHGGGGAPKKVNDQQWENQKKLYKLEEGIYLVPRAPTDTWNLWHQGHIDGFFDELIRSMVLAEGVDPDRVYLTGYSAGGDGVYQLAPRMADRFAAAAMMAGHPNETQADGLRNLPFALHVGGEDGAYDRNKIARQWKVKLSELAALDSGGYENQVVVHEGKGHWMDREEASAMPWMAGHARNLRPAKIVWLQDDVLHERFYWLRNSAPKARERVVVSREGQVITIHEAPPGTQLEILLDDSMCDLSLEVIVRHGETELFREVPVRSAATIKETLEERGDRNAIFCSEIVVSVPSGD